MKTRLLSLLLTALLLAACSVEISDVTPAATPLTTLPTAPPVLTAAPPTSPAPTALPLTPGAPPPWAALNLSGQIVFLTLDQSVTRLARLDLATGELTTVFQPPEQAWITGSALSPDGKQIVLSYAPPPAADEIQYGYTRLYMLAADGGGEPQLILPGADPKESFFNPVWSPDGKYIYYSHFVILRDSAGVITGYKYALERRAYPDGQPEPIADDAIWPRLSPDGTRLAYVFYSLTDARAELRVADADGQNSTALPLPASFIAVDVPMFTPDGQALLFSGSDTAGPASVSWFDEMLGVQRAEAHSLPSDWYRMSLSGGAPERLTHIQDTGLYGGLSPDGRRLAFIAATGVYVMNLDGSQLTPLLNIPAFGTMDWAR